MDPIGFVLTIILSKYLHVGTPDTTIKQQTNHHKLLQTTIISNIKFLWHANLGTIIPSLCLISLNHLVSIVQAISGAVNLTLYPKEKPFHTFANKADPDQAALVRAAWPGSTLLAYGNMIRYDPTLVDLTSIFFVLCTNMKVYLYNYS